MAQATGQSLELLQRKIDQLDAALHKAKRMQEKAASMAQLTRSGHVYVRPGATVNARILDSFRYRAGTSTARGGEGREKSRRN